MENIRTVKNKTLYICIFMLSVISALIVFQLLYTYNNKYTQKGNQPINGLIYIDNTDTDKINYLINDWAYYENALLTPKDFENGAPNKYMQYVSIGERTSLTSQKPFGSGTYSMVLSLPQRNNIYGLYLPQIYSAYELYINDELIESTGSIHNYEPLVKDKTLYFNASGITRIIIAVSDHTGIYSGIVYPPAFGSANAVSRLRDAQLFISCTIFALSLVLFIISAFIVCADKDKSTLIFSLLCLFALGAVCYPLMHTFLGMKCTFLQGIELLSSYMIYTLILLLQNRLCAVNKKITVTVFSVCIIMCISAFLYGFLAPLHTLNARRYFSYIITLYKCLTALYLFSTAVYGTSRGLFNTAPPIFGSGFFAVSVAADRLFPLYEPIYCGWFPEIGCTVMITMLGFVHFININKTYRMNIVLEAEKEQMNKKIEIQKESYNQIAEQMDSTKRLRHDMKQHIYVMESLLTKGEYDSLKSYLSSYKASFEGIKTELFCHNLTINALLHYYSMCARKITAEFNASVSANKDIPVSDTDLSIIFGNLIENAIEACAAQKNGKRKINIYGLADDNKLMLCITNTFDNPPVKKGDKFLSAKRDDLGIGIESVKKTAEKYGGVVKIEYDNMTFKVSVAVFY
ncbi:MAG: ATP-binding protein [Clostridia bacterium]|nr:ATP-binding protein [Clostridia bacterium]